jgi:hypothetical protein
LVLADRFVPRRQLTRQHFIWCAGSVAGVLALTMVAWVGGAESFLNAFTRAREAN